jgi:membrane-associated phospholipid phosphatase
MKKLLTLILAFAIANNLSAQDSLKIYKEKLTYKDFIIPTALIGTGIALKSKNTQISIQETAQKTFGTNFHTEIDNYIQFAPAAQALVGNLLGFESKHGYKQMMTNIAISNIAVGVVTFGVKTAYHDLRPDGSSNNSFSSGHTATAFNNATLLFLEYKDSNIWYASSGFAFATATGVLRMANNRHWAGDVVAGAGIGIAIATVVTYWNPFNFDKKQNKKVSFIGYPFLNDKTTGVGLLCRIN